MFCSRSSDRNAGSPGQLQCHSQGAEAALQRNEGRQREMGKLFEYFIDKHGST